MRNGWALLGICGALGCSGPGTPEEPVYQDSLGVRVGESGERFVALPGEPDGFFCDDTTAVTGGWSLFGGSYYVGLCPRSDPMPSATDCRPLVCTGDTECPDGSPLFDIRCEAGRCIRDGEPLLDLDVILECLIDVPRQTDCSDPLGHAITLGTAIGDAIPRSCDDDGVCTGPIVCP